MQDMLFLFSFMVIYEYFGYKLELGLVIGFRCLLCDISYYFYNLKYIFLYFNSPFTYINIKIYLNYLTISNHIIIISNNNLAQYHKY
jgi:hypothetical protein